MSPLSVFPRDFAAAEMADGVAHARSSVCTRVVRDAAIRALPKTALEQPSESR